MRNQHPSQHEPEQPMPLAPWAKRQCRKLCNETWPEVLNTFYSFLGGDATRFVFYALLPSLPRVPSACIFAPTAFSSPWMSVPAGMSEKVEIVRGLPEWRSLHPRRTTNTPSFTNQQYDGIKPVRQPTSSYKHLLWQHTSKIYSRRGSRLSIWPPLPTPSRLTNPGGWNQDRVQGLGAGGCEKQTEWRSKKTQILTCRSRVHGHRMTPQIILSHFFRLYPLRRGGV